MTAISRGESPASAQAASMARARPSPAAGSSGSGSKPAAWPASRPISGRVRALVGRVGQEAPERRAEHDAGPRLGRRGVEARRRERPARGGEHELGDALGARRTPAHRLREVAERDAAVRADDERRVRWQASGLLAALDDGPGAGYGDGRAHPARPRTRAAFTPAKPDEVDTAVSAGR